MKDKRTYAQRADTIKRAVIKRRRAIREKAVSSRGGKCETCGYDRCIAALEFHHRDPSQKDFAISADGNTRSWQRVQKEIEQCALVCANCHREIHAGITQLPTGMSVENEVN